MDQVEDVIKILEFSYQRQQAEILFDKIYNCLLKYPSVKLKDTQSRGSSNTENLNEKQVENATLALQKMHTENLLNYTTGGLPNKLAKILSSSVMVIGLL